MKPPASRGVHIDRVIHLRVDTLALGLCSSSRSYVTGVAQHGFFFQGFAYAASQQQKVVASLRALGQQQKQAPYYMHSRFRETWGLDWRVCVYTCMVCKHAVFTI